MIELAEFNINQIDSNSIYLTWSFEDTVEDLSNFSIKLYRAETPGEQGDVDDFDLIASGITTNTFSYVDEGVSNLETFGRLWYYKMKIENTETSEESIQPDFAVYFKNESLDLVTKEILRRKRIALRSTYGGRTYHLLKKRTWGTHCSLCWDATLQRATDPNCPECYGTGWSQAFFSSIPFSGMTTPDPRRSEILMFGEWRPSDVLLTSLNYPPLSQRDIIIDDRGNRWSVFQRQTVTKKGFLIEQKCQLALIQPEDITYSISIDFNKEAENYVIS